jgi:preprotein translocase subunit SecD
MHGLQRRIRAQALQAEQYHNDQMEHNLRAEACAKKKDRVGAKHYLEEAHKAAYYYDLELKQKSNLQEVHRRLREAVINAETVKHLSAASLTLEQLQKESPLEKLDDIMDSLQDGMIQTKQQSEILSFNLNEQDVDAELDDLMEKSVTVALPSVPNTNISNSVVSSKGQEKLRTE